MKSSHAYNRICCSSYINLSQFLCVEHKHNLCLIHMKGEDWATRRTLLMPETVLRTVAINYDILLLFCHMCHWRSDRISTDHNQRHLHLHLHSPLALDLPHPRFGLPSIIFDFQTFYVLRLRLMPRAINSNSCATAH